MHARTEIAKEMAVTRVCLGFRLGFLAVFSLTQVLAQTPPQGKSH